MRTTCGDVGAHRRPRRGHLPGGRGRRPAEPDPRASPCSPPRRSPAGMSRSVRQVADVGGERAGRSPVRVPAQHRLDQGRGTRPGCVRPAGGAVPPRRCPRTTPAPRRRDQAMSRGAHPSRCSTPPGSPPDGPSSTPQPSGRSRACRCSTSRAPTRPAWAPAANLVSACHAIGCRDRCVSQASRPAYRRYKCVKKTCGGQACASGNRGGGCAEGAGRADNQKSRECGSGGEGWRTA